ncbi:MAG TPA: hypothetical protein VGC56_06615 [Allosphingosinicella sp.]|jgi:hypothetical protein
MDSTGAGPLHWWQSRWGVAAIALACALPLLWPSIPPLLDLPGHMAAYKVELDYAHSPYLRGYYSLHWAPMGNLGVNLLILPMAKWFGLELGTKLIVLAIPPLTALGFLWTAREMHGRIPPTALFAVPLAYCYPFVFGFVNFAMSMALGFLAFALWARLGRLGRWRLRALLFPPITALVWLAHTFGWGTLGILAFSFEFVRGRDRGEAPVRAALRAALECLPLILPIILMLVWRSGDVAGKTEGWFSLGSKISYMKFALRDRWIWLDLPAILLVYGLVVAALAKRRLGMSRVLAAGAAFLFLAYLCIPQRIFGSGYADMRLFPYTLAAAVLAIRPATDASPRLMRGLALAGLLFIGVRLAGNSWSFALYDAEVQRELPALDRLPRGARLVSFVGTPCRTQWHWTRLDHLPGLAVVRREAFANDQWSVAGAQLNRASYPQAGAFQTDPSQIVRLGPCSVNRWPTLDKSLRAFPRGAFDYLWLINPPAWDRSLTAGMVPVWTNGRSMLFRIVDRNQPVSRSTDTLPVAEP